MESLIQKSAILHNPDSFFHPPNLITLRGCSHLSIYQQFLCLPRSRCRGCSRPCTYTGCTSCYVSDARQLSQDVPAGAVVLCDVAAILRDTIRETLRICKLALFMHAGCLEGERELRITKFHWNSLNRWDHLRDLDVDGGVLVCSSDCIQRSINVTCEVRKRLELH